MEFNPSKVELLKNFKEMLLGLIQLPITYSSSIPLLCKGRPSWIPVHYFLKKNTMGSKLFIISHSYFHFYLSGTFLPFWPNIKSFKKLSREIEGVEKIKCHNSKKVWLHSEKPQLWFNAHSNESQQGTKLKNNRSGMN